MQHDTPPVKVASTDGLGLGARSRERPEWVHCIGFGGAISADGNRTWCGLDERPFFLDVDHAALNGAHGGRLVACRACVSAIIVALQNGHDDPEYVRP